MPPVPVTTLLEALKQSGYLAHRAKFGNFSNTAAEVALLLPLGEVRASDKEPTFTGPRAIEIAIATERLAMLKEELTIRSYVPPADSGDCRRNYPPPSQRPFGDPTTEQIEWSMAEVNYFLELTMNQEAVTR